MHFDEILKNLPALFSSLLVSILFVQSSLDKFFDWGGNLGWLTGHFSKTILRGMVVPMLATIAVLEFATGLLAGAGIIYFLATGSLVVIFGASIAGAAALTALFFGQRVAKDYPGAAILVPYFILMLVTMLLTNPYSRLGIR